MLASGGLVLQLVVGSSSSSYIKWIMFLIVELNPGRLLR